MAEEQEPEPALQAPEEEFAQESDDSWESIDEVTGPPIDPQEDGQA